MLSRAMPDVFLILLTGFQTIVDLGNQLIVKKEWRALLC